MALCGGGGGVAVFFFVNDTATTEIYTLSLHDALPILVAWAPNHGGNQKTAFPLIQGVGAVVGP